MGAQSGCAVKKIKRTSQTQPKGSMRNLISFAGETSNRQPTTIAIIVMGTMVITHFIKCSVSNQPGPEKIRFGSVRDTIKQAT